MVGQGEVRAQGMRVGDVRGGWCGETHRQQAEGKSFRIDLALDAGGPSALTLDYDAVLEADTGPEAVVLLTDAAGDISTAAVPLRDRTALSVGTAAHGWTDMVGLGLHHVRRSVDSRGESDGPGAWTEPRAGTGSETGFNK